MSHANPICRTYHLYSSPGPIFRPRHGPNLSWSDNSRGRRGVHGECRDGTYFKYSSSSEGCSSTIYSSVEGDACLMLAASHPNLSKILLKRRYAIIAIIQFIFLVLALSRPTHYHTTIIFISIKRSYLICF